MNVTTFIYLQTPLKLAEYSSFVVNFLEHTTIDLSTAEGQRTTFLAVTRTAIVIFTMRTTCLHSSLASKETAGTRTWALLLQGFHRSAILYRAC